MTRLIVISNRVNVPTAEDKGAAGGLSMALTAALREYQGIWFGWSGQLAETFTGQIAMRRINGVTSATIDLEEQDYEEYYNGYANNVLWPLFHFRVDLTEYDRAFDAGYARVNARFAETVRPLIEPDDIVWVHDYHLIPCGEELRKRGLQNAMGFFLHVPWPPRQLLSTLPKHTELVRSLFSYDLVGFQTEEWLEAFVDFITQEVGGKREPDGRLTCFGRTICVAAFPIGIDADEFMQMPNSREGRAAYVRIKKSLVERALVIGVDRLDYSKGIDARFQAYEAVLDTDPDLAGRVVMVQIAPPSREDVNAYQLIREQLDSLAGHVNGKFSDFDWTPLRYVNRGYPREELAGIYRASRVAFVTPLRDGMNLVAKEFIAAQDPEDPGVLILSQFAGAAAQLGDALIVNPFSPDDMVDALRRALTMPLAERKRRYESLIRCVREQDVIWWRERFVSALQGIRKHGGAKGLHAVS